MQCFNCIGRQNATAPAEQFDKEKFFAKHSNTFILFFRIPQAS